MADKKSDCQKGVAMIKVELGKKHPEAVLAILRSALKDAEGEVIEEDWSECLDVIRPARVALAGSWSTSRSISIRCVDECHCGGRASSSSSRRNALSHRPQPLRACKYAENLLKLHCALESQKTAKGEFEYGLTS